MADIRIKITPVLAPEFDSVVKQGADAQTRAEKKAAADRKKEREREFAEFRNWLAERAAIHVASLNKQLKAEETFAKKAAQVRRDVERAQAAATTSRARAKRERETQIVDEGVAEARRVFQYRAAQQKAETAARKRDETEIEAHRRNERKKSEAEWARRNREFDRQARADQHRYDLEHWDNEKRQLERQMAREARIQARDRNLNRVAGAANVIGQGARFAFGFGRRVLNDVAGAYGVPTDWQSYVQSNVELERRAVELSNVAYMPGKAGMAGVRQEPAALVRTARDVAERYAYDPLDAIEGLQRFAAKTGDLETGRAILDKMAVLSRATGSNLADMVDAAADVANNLGNVANKGEVVDAVMRRVAAQGKEGAVEIRDLATKMAKVAANSAVFEGSMANNITTFSALAQIARGRGGAASAAEAASSVQSLANTFGKNVRIEGFKKHGIDPLSKKEYGKFRDLPELMLELLQNTRADPRKMNEAIKDAQAQRPLKGMAAVYREAFNASMASTETGGMPLAEREKRATEEATKAYQAAWKEAKGPLLQEAELRASVNMALRTQSAEAQRFTNEMSKLVGEAQRTLWPAIRELGPAILDITRSLLTRAGLYDTSREITDYASDVSHNTPALTQYFSWQDWRKGKPATDKTFDPMTGEVVTVPRTRTGQPMEIGEGTLRDAEQELARSKEKEKAAQKIVVEDLVAIREPGAGEEKIKAAKHKATADNQQFMQIAEDVRRQEASVEAMKTALKYGVLKVHVVEDDTSKPGGVPPKSNPRSASGDAPHHAPQHESL